MSSSNISPNDGVVVSSSAFTFTLAKEKKSFKLSCFSLVKHDAMLTVISFKLFVAYLLLLIVVSPEQLLMELCSINDDDNDDGDDEAFDSGEDGCAPKNAVSSNFAFNTRIIE